MAGQLDGTITYRDNFMIRGQNHEVRYDTICCADVEERQLTYIIYLVSMDLSIGDL